MTIEHRFSQLTDICLDLSVFPITESSNQPHRDFKESHGEVFTPIHLVDKMIIQAKPEPDEFCLDLCAGQGQFTVRMLRYFINGFPDFDFSYYLKNFHWLNEINPVNVKALYEIFGTDINLAAGDACQLHLYPTDDNGIWEKGTWWYHEKLQKWLREKPAELPAVMISSSAKLF